MCISLYVSTASLLAVCRYSLRITNFFKSVRFLIVFVHFWISLFVDGNGQRHKTTFTDSKIILDIFHKQPVKEKLTMKMTCKLIYSRMIPRK